MSKVFLSSDLHFCHNREFLYKPRGYNCIEEHDACLVSIWNQTVSPEDTAYLLGDVMLNDNARGMYWLAQLNGNIKIIRGNHDTDTRVALYQNLPNVEVIGYATVIKYKKYNIYLSHYPTRTSNYDDGVSLHRKVLSFCGHSHTTDRFTDWDDLGVYHVEWDAHGRPVELDAAIKEIREKVNGFYEPAALGLNYADNLELNYTTPIITINPAAPVMSCVARCDKCVYTWPMCGGNDSLGSCPNYKRDPPDGGYYG